MNYEERSQLLKEQGITVEMIASALNISPQAVYQTMNDGRSSRRIAEAIAELCKKPLITMFPYYEEQVRKEAMQKKVARKLAKYVQE